MSGHSKWANIKHKKERADKHKGKIFSRLAKEIISAVKVGDADPKNNPRLRLVIQKAKAANMPNENIDRNIKKASNADQADYESVAYEFYGHGGVGLIVEAMTDNKNRTASEMRIATNKRGGVIAQPGAVSFNFDRKGVIQLERGERDEEALFELVLEAGAEDFEVVDEVVMVTTDPSELYAVKEKLDAQELVALEVDIVMIPKLLIECDEKIQSANMALIDWLEDLEDVNAVYHNMEI